MLKRNRGVRLESQDPIEHIRAGIVLKSGLEIRIAEPGKPTHKYI